MNLPEERCGYEKILHRKALRLSGYDYSSSGAYFITVCSNDRKPLFAIPRLCNILKDQWELLPLRFPSVTIDVLVVMSDHIHCILLLEEDVDVEKKPTVSDILGAYKSLANVEWLRYIKVTGMKESGRIWQRSFYDHIIRNELDFVEKQTYILNNPVVDELKKEREREDKGDGRVLCCGNEECWKEAAQLRGSGTVIMEGNSSMRFL